MNRNISFSYSYSAKDNKEIQEIRKKYLPREESKLDELKRLDQTVQASGKAESLCVGIIGSLIFGMGMCLVMKVIWMGVWSIVLGVLLGFAGMVCIAAAYPIYRWIFSKARSKYSPRILELAEELCSTNNSKL